jgi:hypothetical protein
MHGEELRSGILRFRAGRIARSLNWLPAVRQNRAGRLESPHMARPAVAAEQLSCLNAQRTDLTGQGYLPVHRWREHSPGAITLG